ncbi:MAG: hypothetical protein LBR66_01495 [Candidatus Symbiothrix sp.]|jgi:hypothetical protein|nr:hypothetical protein [Candidatus Symbiothrix sp.]
MVFYSEQSRQDLEDILYGLITWDKHPLTYEHAHVYVSDIRAVCGVLDSISYHSLALYETHLNFGRYVFAYKRNPRTTWYIIYDIDNQKNVYIQKIISNYLTVW